MEWNWVYNINCIDYVTGNVRTYSDKCPLKGDKKGWCVKDEDCKYFMGIKTTELGRNKGCCSWIRDNNTK